MMDLAQVRSRCGSRLWNDFYELKLEALQYVKKNQRFGMEDQRLVSSVHLVACGLKGHMQQLPNHGMFCKQQQGPLV